MICLFIKRIFANFSPTAWLASLLETEGPLTARGSVGLRTVTRTEDNSHRGHSLKTLFEKYQRTSFNDVLFPFLWDQAENLILQS